MADERDEAEVVPPINPHHQVTGRLRSWEGTTSSVNPMRADRGADQVKYGSVLARSMGAAR